MKVPTADEFMDLVARVSKLEQQRRISRYKDGSRTLISRAEIDEYLRKQPR